MNLTVTSLPECVVVAPAGRLTASTAPRLRDELNDRIQSGQNKLAIDMTELEFIDSSGLGALIGGLKVARLAGGDLRIAAVPTAVQRVLALTNLDRVLKSYPDARAAYAND
ncbi:STAS domain-containing protein [Microbacterium schleiferi]|uniref:STAS domain-containing protein n=1 Tax=Microbacterium schleiferi TaxID=69362 RepID=UPI00311E8009